MSRIRSPYFYLAAVVAAYAALWLLIPRATFLPIIADAIDTAMRFSQGDAVTWLSFAGLILVVTPTVVFMAIQIGLVYCYSRIRMNFWQCAAVLLVSLALVEALIALVVWQLGLASKIGYLPRLSYQLSILAQYYGPLKILMTLSLICVFASVGYLVSLRIKDKNLLLPVVMVAACIDFLTVTVGPVSLVVKHAPKVVEAVSAPIPQVGTGAFMPMSTVGPGDFLFMAIVFAVVHKLAMRPARNYWFVCVAMILGMMGVLNGDVGAIAAKLGLPLDTGLPALVVLAAAVTAANWREFRLSREEKVSVAVVGVALIALVSLAWTALRPVAETAIKKHTAPGMKQNGGPKGPP